MALAAQTYHGLNLSWGLGNTTYTMTGVTGQFQSSDHSENYEQFVGKDQRGNTIAWVGYDPTGEATFEVLVTDGNSATGSAAITFPNQGTMVTVTAESGDPNVGTNWIVQTPAVKRNNTAGTIVSVKAIRYLGITT